MVEELVTGADRFTALGENFGSSQFTNYNALASGRPGNAC